MVQQPSKLRWGKRMWVFIQGVVFTVLIPIQAAVAAVVAWLVFKNTNVAGDVLWVFLVLGVLAIAVDRCMYRAQLKLTLVERDQARAAAAHEQQQPVRAES